jgi:hypothetical protein
MKKYSKSQLFAIMILVVLALCCIPSLSFSVGPDVNTDGNVDIHDLTLVIQNLGNYAGCPLCDVDGNFLVNTNDAIDVDTSCDLPGCAICDLPGCDINPRNYICSTFGDDPDNSSMFDTDIFKFYGAKGEQVAIYLVSDPVRNGWEKRALLTLSYRGLVKEDWSLLKPYNLINAKLPEDGFYTLTVTGKQLEGGNLLLRGNYCILLEPTPHGIYHTITPEEVESVYP